MKDEKGGTGDGTAARSVAACGLPAELEFLRAPALAFVGNDREIVGCGQVDFCCLERALSAEISGLTAKQALAKRARQSTLLNQWLAEHETSTEPLVVGLRFVSSLLCDFGS